MKQVKTSYSNLDKCLQWIKKKNCRVLSVSCTSNYVFIKYGGVNYEL